MKLKTSSCNLTILKKDITRFAPVWILYTLFLLVLVMSCMGQSTYYYHHSFDQSLANRIPSLGILSCAYALLNAQLLFGDLFKARMANALHALPMRRQDWFRGHTAAGLLFCLAPNLLIMAVNICLVTEVPGLWLWFFLISVLQYVFYFGLAVLCVMLAGSRFAMVVVFGLCSAGAVILEWLVNILYIPLLPGITLGGFVLMPLCPLAYNYLQPPVTVSIEYNGFGWVAKMAVEHNADQWWYLAIIAVAGLALLWPALRLYRRRQLEVAGSFIAVGALKPIFLVLFTLSAGAAVQYFLGSTYAVNWLYLGVGLVAGYFGGQMLLNRTVRVFNLRVLGGFAVFAAVLLGSMGLTFLDPLGIRYWVPAPEQISDLYATLPGYSGSLSREDENMLREMAAIHQSAIEERDVPIETWTETIVYEDYDGQEYSYEVTRKAGYDIQLYYMMESGIYMDRNYTVPYDGQTSQFLERFLNRPEVVLAELYDEFGDVAELVRLEIGSKTIYDREAVEALREAIIKDCDNGTMEQYAGMREEDETYYEVTFRWRLPGEVYPYGRNYYVTVRIYPDAAHSMAWLEQQEFFEELIPSRITE